MVCEGLRGHSTEGPHSVGPEAVPQDAARALEHEGVAPRRHLLCFKATKGSRAGWNSGGCLARLRGACCSAVRAESTCWVNLFSGNANKTASFG